MDTYSYVLKHVYLNVMKVFNISNTYFILDILENTDKQKGVAFTVLSLWTLRGHSDVFNWSLAWHKISE